MAKKPVKKVDDDDDVDEAEVEGDSNDDDDDGETLADDDDDDDDVSDDNGDEPVDEDPVEGTGEGEHGTSIGEKYDKQMRQLVTQRLDIPLTSLASMIESKQINVSPRFQRRGRWNTKQRSRFVESIIMNVPIPPVFLGEDEYGKYVVLDGRQRITALYEYIRGHYALEGLEVWEELNGEKFDNIEEVQPFIFRRFLPAIAILNESSKVIKYDVFDRLNTGGVVLTPMELRNALHRGKFTKTLHKLSRNKTFRQLWGIPEKEEDRKTNSIYRKMLDLEFVLRFFALERYRDFKDKAKFNGFLSNVMIQKNAEYADDALSKTADVAAFERAVECCQKVLGNDAFRKPSTGRRRSPRSAPFADAVMHAFANVDPSQLSKATASDLKTQLHALLNEEAFAAATGSGTNGRGAITLRLERAAEVVGSAVPADALVTTSSRSKNSSSSKPRQKGDKSSTKNAKQRRDGR